MQVGAPYEPSIAMLQLALQSIRGHISSRQKRSSLCAHAGCRHNNFLFLEGQYFLRAPPFIDGNLIFGLLFAQYAAEI